jgi:NTE family protein
VVIPVRKITVWLFLVCLAFIVSCAPRETLQPTLPVKPARIAVVLGAGASRGFAHIGVLKVLETNQVPMHLIVGTSAGSLVGSIYAAGFNAFQLQKIAMGLQKDDVIDYILPDNGFIRGEKLENFVNKTVNRLPLEKMRIPLRVVATDIRTGEEVVFATGSTGWAVRASCSVPGVFQPVQIGKKTYVDGGVVSPVAVHAARQAGADVVIAVDISSGVNGSAPQGTIDTILQSVDIMYSRISAIQLKDADVVIRPKVNHIGSADFDKRDEVILEGEKAAVAALPQIKQILDRLRQEGRLGP